MEPIKALTAAVVRNPMAVAEKVPMVAVVRNPMAAAEKALTADVEQIKVLAAVAEKAPMVAAERIMARNLMAAAEKALAAAAAKTTTDIDHHARSRSWISH